MGFWTYFEVASGRIFTWIGVCVCVCEDPKVINVCV